MKRNLTRALARRSRPSFEDGLPAAVIRAVDATIYSGGGVTKHHVNGRVLSVHFCRPSGPALEALAGLRNAVCTGPDEWTWAPDATDDVALEGRPFLHNLYLLPRAS